MQLRAYIYAMPEDIADVGSMAWDMGISRSSFQHMYKKMFGVSVMTDVISARMERASQLHCNDKSQRKGKWLRGAVILMNMVL